MAEMGQELGVNRDTIKALIMCIVYGGTPRLNKKPVTNSCMASLTKELIGFRNNMCDGPFKDVFLDRCRQKLSKSNTVASTISIICCAIENALLRVMVDCVREAELEVSGLFLDGVGAVGQYPPTSQK